MHCGPPGSSVRGILQAGILECVAMPPTGDLPNPEIEPVSLASPILVDGFFTSSTTWEAQLHTHRCTHSETLLDFSLSLPPWQSMLLHMVSAPRTPANAPVTHGRVGLPMTWLFTIHSLGAWCSRVGTGSFHLDLR